MRTAPKRPPVYSIDTDGTPIALIPLATGGSATIDATDLDQLLRQGLTPNWTLNDNGSGWGYVRAKSPDNLVSIAREIMRPRAGDCVKYRNGNRRDLRRSNLYVVGGARRGRSTMIAG